MANRLMHVRDAEDNTYQIKIVRNELVALSINGIVVPESELTEHLTLLARIDYAWSQARVKKQEEVDRLKARLSASP